jgi:hypothetical protein
MSTAMQAKHDMTTCLRCQERRHFSATVYSVTRGRGGWTDAASIQELMDRLQRERPGEQLFVQLYGAEGIEGAQRDVWLFVMPQDSDPGWIAGVARKEHDAWQHRKDTPTAELFREFAASFHGVPVNVPAEVPAPAAATATIAASAAESIVTEADEESEERPDTEEERIEHELSEHIWETDPVFDAEQEVEHAIEAAGYYAFERRYEPCRVAGRCLKLNQALPQAFVPSQEYPHNFNCHCQAACDYLESIERARDFLELARAQAVLLGPDLFEADDVEAVAGLAWYARASAAERGRIRQQRHEMQAELHNRIVDEINAAPDADFRED